VRHDEGVHELGPQSVAAIAVVEKALQRAAAGTGAVHVKQGRDVVTDTDIAVEDLIREELSSEFGWPVIGEERGAEIPAARPYWLVDPICGTRNFAAGVPLFAVNVALVEDGQVSVAVIGDGATGEIAVAERSRGARSRPGGLALRPDAASAMVDVEAWPSSPSTRLLAARRAAALDRVRAVGHPIVLIDSLACLRGLRAPRGLCLVPDPGRRSHGRRVPPRVRSRWHRDRPRGSSMDAGVGLRALRRDARASPGTPRGDGAPVTRPRRPGDARAHPVGATAARQDGD
jgi:fructose-1,6-bisphosphatase/inositol monophosphatase family enzyme